MLHNKVSCHRPKADTRNHAGEFGCLIFPTLDRKGLSLEGSIYSWEFERKPLKRSFPFLPLKICEVLASLCHIPLDLLRRQGHSGYLDSYTAVQDSIYCTTARHYFDPEWVTFTVVMICTCEKIAIFENCEMSMCSAKLLLLNNKRLTVNEP